MQKKKILFVGAGGMVAGKVLPHLAKQYDIVGIAGRRQDLREYCVEFHSIDLLTAYSTLFPDIFSRHTFDAIVWNTTRYFLYPIMDGSRENLHAEFDLNIALPIECLRFAKNTFSGGVFILVTSMSAFSRPPNQASYAIMKNGQIILAEYIKTELEKQNISSKALALGSVPSIPTDTLQEVFARAIENSDPTKTLYLVNKTFWQ